MRELGDFFGRLPFGVCDFSAVADSLMPVKNMARIPAGAESVIVVLFPYLLPQQAYRNLNISRYAVPCDYHTVVGGILDSVAQRLSDEYPENKFAAFVDNSPFPEVTCAIRAGLGVRGINGLLLNPEYGSFCFIGEIVTDRRFEPSAASVGVCAGCGRCIEACPSGALSAAGFNKNRCISYLTQAKKMPDAHSSELIRFSGSAWGCDICQSACPYNDKAKTTFIEQFINSAVPEVSHDTPMQDRAYIWRGREVILRNLRFLKGENDDEADSCNSKQ